MIYCDNPVDVLYNKDANLTKLITHIVILTF